MRKAKRKVWLGLAGISGILLLSFSLFAKELPRVAVIDFNDEACRVEGLGNLAANVINDQLVQLGRVRVIDRQNLAALLEEQKLSMSGIMDSSSAARAGKVLGIKYIVIGEVNEGAVSRKADTEKHKDYKTGLYKSKKIWKYKGTATLQVRVVEVETGKIVVSQSCTKTEKETGERREKSEELGTILLKKALKVEEKEEDINVAYAHLVTKALRKAGKYFYVDFYNLFKITGYVIKIDEKKRVVTLDLGSEDGVKKGAKFILMEKGEPTIHPVTKEEIPGEEIVLGEIKVAQVGTHSSKAKVSKKLLAKIKVGTIVTTKKKRHGLF